MVLYAILAAFIGGIGLLMVAADTRFSKRQQVIGLIMFLACFAILIILTSMMNPLPKYRTIGLVSDDITHFLINLDHGDIVVGLDYHGNEMKVDMPIKRVRAEVDALRDAIVKAIVIPIPPDAVTQGSLQD